MLEKRTKVLVVDDDAQTLMGTSLRLAHSGYEICTATDGDIGVQLAFSEQPDIVVMDVSMPRMNGLEALVRLREDNRTALIPVVMLSASLRDKQTALDAGARFFVSKPYSFTVQSRIAARKWFW